MISRYRDHPAPTPYKSLAPARSRQHWPNSDEMVRPLCILAAVIAYTIFTDAAPGYAMKRVRRGFDNGPGFGRGGSASREFDVSRGGGCTGESLRSASDSGSREVAYNREGARAGSAATGGATSATRGGRSFAKASSSSSSFSGVNKVM
ncbi:hypothetical protein EVAR_10888_1 [Eumeta japonica]|uniref:Uncharacterized protein n=1 Tax=Eumeta variegata TaxID=151549 RepID=A0A4C1USV6_EUMVA|nr:hypothetical protein EVAR_10888_1 [Eumeta japonica]